MLTLILTVAIGIVALVVNHRIEARRHERKVAAGRQW